VSDLLPAWSEPFHTGPPVAPLLGLDHPITREWAYGDRSGRGVAVAVVDSGIEAGHPLVGPVQRSVEVVRDDESDDGVRFEEGPHDDLYGHDTACAGIIRELAPEVELVSVRVLGANLKGNASAFAHGLDWCIDQESMSSASACPPPTRTGSRRSTTWSTRRPSPERCSCRR
jgi:subtilisin family serine protease